MDRLRTCFLASLVLASLVLWIAVGLVSAHGAVGQPVDRSAVPRSAGAVAAGAGATPSTPETETTSQVYAVPFATEGGRLRLTVANRTGQKARSVAVVAEEVPPWITLAAPRRAAGALAEGDEATVTFTFDVAREAPVGKVQALRFAVQSAGGALATKALATKEIRLKVAPPEKMTLEGNWPNPFSGRTTIGYRLPRAAEVQVAVYDLLGRRVALIEEGRHPPGAQTLSWQARGLASGVYLYRLRATPAGGSPGSGPGSTPMVRHGRMTLVR